MLDRELVRVRRVKEIQFRAIGLVGTAIIAGLVSSGNVVGRLYYDVIQADGGTRTAAISGSYIALVLAVERLLKKGEVERNPVHGQVAAISVGIFQGKPVLDLDYEEDAEAETRLQGRCEHGDRKRLPARRPNRWLNSPGLGARWRRRRKVGR